MSTNSESATTTNPVESNQNTTPTQNETNSFCMNDNPPSQIFFFPNYLSSHLAIEELKEAIRNQIEFYFSAQNLPSDTYLLSKMDSEQFVPVSLIANFGKIKSLTLDQEIIIQALDSSSVLELSEDKSKIRLKEKKKRNRIILHKLPSGTTEQVRKTYKLMSIFSFSYSYLPFFFLFSSKSKICFYLAILLLKFNQM